MANAAKCAEEGDIRLASMPSLEWRLAFRDLVGVWLRMNIAVVTVSP
jgi:hypothetical protein